MFKESKFADSLFTEGNMEQTPRVTITIRFIQQQSSISSYMISSWCNKCIHIKFFLKPEKPYNEWVNFVHEIACGC